MTDGVVLEESVVFFVSKSGITRFFETGLALICHLVLAFP
jgi:hypothetical protein